MVNRRTTEYEYKIISSFYDNYLKQHNYLNIKRIVLGICFSTNEENKMIKQFHEFLLCMTITSKENILNNLKRCSKFSLDIEMSEETCNMLEKIINEETMDDVQKSLRLLECSMVEKDVRQAYILFILSGMYLNFYYKDYVVIPVYMFTQLEAIVKDYEIRYIFYKSLIEQTLKCHDNNLKEKIIKVYEENKDNFISFGIDKLFLFGSIIDDTYYEHSDIDIVIKMKENGNYYEARKLLIEFNKEHFSMDSDIIESDDFIALNPCVKKYKVF